MSVTAKKSEKNPKRPRKYVRWKPIFLVHIYRYAKAGLSDEAIARALEVSRNSIKLWKAEREGVREALDLARQEVPDENSFLRYFYSRLDRPLQDLWDELEGQDRLGATHAQIERLFADHGDMARKALFLHAMVKSYFSPTRAMEKVGIDKRYYDRWLSSDPEFARLVKEIDWHRANYYEEAFMKLVESGDKTAILFAQKTFNKKRGYGLSQSVDVNVSGEIEHTHKEVIDLGELDLDLDTRMKILDARRRLEESRKNQRLLDAMPASERALLGLADRIRESADL